MKEKIKINDQEPNTYKVLRSILFKELNPKKLSKKVRQDCIEVLKYEGLDIDEIVMFLDSNEENIRRDLNEISKRESKTEHLTRMIIKINVVNGVHQTARKSFQTFKRLPNEKMYQAVTREIVIQEEN